MNFLKLNYKNLTEEEKPEQIRFFLILVFVFSLPFDIFYSQIILGLLIITTILDFKKSRIKLIPKQAWIYMSLYFISVIGYFYSTDKSSAGFLLERQLAILLMPVLIPISININEKRKQSILNIFAVTCTVTVIFLLIQTVLEVRLLQLPIRAILSSTFFNHNFSKPIGIHATYLSIYIALSVFYLIDRYIKCRSLAWNILIIVTIGILLLGQFFLASRTIIMATFFISLFVLPGFLMKRKKSYYLIIIPVITSIVIVAFNIGYINHRFGNEMFNDLFSGAKTSASHVEAEPRIERWKGAIELIEDSPLIGYGTGDEIKMLKFKYLIHRQYVSYFYQFNAHNQYLSYTIKHGVLGLLVFIMIFFYYVRFGIKNGDSLYASFIILLLISFFTENILDANKGIFFFAFFNTLFGYTILMWKQQDPENKNLTLSKEV